MSGSPDYVGFWKRFVAFLIDMLIIMVVGLPILVGIYGTGYLSRDPAGGFAGFWDFAVQVILPAVAVILFWRFGGATPGKMAISARIVDERTLGAPSTARLVVRYFAYIISTIPLFLGFVWIAIDRRKQAWHDKIAGTLVIYDDD